MQLANRLFHWYKKRDDYYAEVKKYNERKYVAYIITFEDMVLMNSRRAQEIAVREGWKYSDLLSTVTYQAMHRHKKLSMEMITGQGMSSLMLSWLCH